MSRPCTIITVFEINRRTLAQILTRLERLHDLTADGRLTEATPLEAGEVAAWLREIASVAEETIREIDARATWLNVVAEITRLPVDRDLNA